MRNRILGLLVASLSVASLSAQLYLPQIIADDMVLQQQTEVALWGKGVPGKKVTIKTGWNKKQYAATIKADSTWRIKVATPKASFDAYSIVFNSGETKTVKNILIGEVWLCSGQSNMEMPMKGYTGQPVEGSLSDIVNSTDNYLRCYTVGRNSILKEQYDTKGRWEIAGPNTTPDFTATGYYFARQLRRTLNVPVAILHSSWSGSAIEPWIPAEGFQQVPNQKLPQTDEDNKHKNQVPTVLWNGMLNPIAGYTIKGAIWYQGESNRMRYQEYPALFNAMHSQWIKRWGQGAFPIYFCQIAPFSYAKETAPTTALMREAQEKIALTQPHTGMAILMDSGEPRCIHPAKKQVAGERLSYIALNRNYGFTGIQYSPGSFDKVAFENGRARISFKNVPGGMIPRGTVEGGFQIAGADKKFYPAKASVNTKRRTCDVWSEQVPEPVAVRYAFGADDAATIFCDNGLPFSSFRTDDWDDVK